MKQRKSNNMKSRITRVAKMISNNKELRRREFDKLNQFLDQCNAIKSNHLNRIEEAIEISDPQIDCNFKCNQNVNVKTK